MLLHFCIELAAPLNTNWLYMVLYLWEQCTNQRKKKTHWIIWKKIDSNLYTVAYRVCGTCGKKPNWCPFNLIDMFLAKGWPFQNLHTEKQQERKKIWYCGYSHSGMCCSNGLIFHKISQDMGLLSVTKSINWLNFQEKLLYRMPTFWFVKIW